MKLLEETVKELKGEDLDDDVRAAVNLQVDFRIPESYVTDVNQRLSIYRRVASARTEDEIGRVLDDARDRYGAPPPALLNLADFGRVRVRADRLGLESIDRDGSLVVFKFRERTQVDVARLLTLVRARPDLQLVPPGSLKLDLRHGGGRPDYRLLHATGPDHEKSFRVEVWVDGEVLGVGEGLSRRQAETAAAAQAIDAPARHPRCRAVAARTARPRPEPAG